MKKIQKPTKNSEWGLIKEWTSLCLSHASKTKVSHVNTTFTNNDTGRVKKKLPFALLKNTVTLL